MANGNRLATHRYNAIRSVMTSSAEMYIGALLYNLRIDNDVGLGRNIINARCHLPVDLNYLEIPVLVKYKYEVDDEFTVEPFASWICVAWVWAFTASTHATTRPSTV